LLIVGGGPAGLCAAQYGARAGLATLLIEGGAPGGQALMIEKLENYPGNIDGKSGSEIASFMHRQAESFGADFLMEQAVSIEKTGEAGSFVVRFFDAPAVTGRALILATGAGHRKLNVPNEERLTGYGVSYCANCDGPFFRNKRIFVVGGGDAACDEARFLSGISDDITMLVRRAGFSAQKAVREMVLRDRNIKVRFNTRVTGIKGEDRVTGIGLEDIKSSKISEERADAVFIFAGIVPNNELVAGNDSKIRLQTDEKGFILTNQAMESSCPGLFAAGDVRSSPFRQVIVAAADGAVAAHSAFSFVKSAGA